MKIINDKKKLSKSFITEYGETIKEPIVAYNEYGNPDGPVIFITHGGLSHHYAAGTYNNEPGYWETIIGPDKPFNTNIFRILTANSLGSMFGTSSPITINPDTGKYYGPDFPKFTFTDTVRFHKLFLEEMEVQKLFLIAGPSMGSLQSLLMSALYPDFVDGAIGIATAGKMPPYCMTIHNFFQTALQMDPEFNEGWYDINQPLVINKVGHMAMRIFYTHNDLIQKDVIDTIPDGPEAVKQRSYVSEKYLTTNLEEHTMTHDPNCMISVLKALNMYDLGLSMESYEQGVTRITCPVLLVNFTTDHEFYPEYAKEVADILNKHNPRQATVKAYYSKWGHLACVKDTDLFSIDIKNFIIKLS